MAPTGSAAARLIPGAAAIVLAGALAMTCSTDGRLTEVVRTLALVGVVLTIASVVGAWSMLSIPAALGLGTAFSLTRFEDAPTIDLRAVMVGVGLLAMCELAAWSAEARTSVPPGVPATTRAATSMLVLVVVAGLTAVLATAATLPVRDVTFLVALGVASLALVGVVVLRLLRDATAGDG